jgi:hypothetical protein
MFLGTGGAKVDQAEAEGLCSRTRARLKRYLGCYAFTPPKDGQLRGTMTYEGAISIHRALGYKDDDVVSVMILMLELANHFVSTREVRLYEKAIEMTDMRLARRIR